jgi:hypothetical protein
VRQKFSVTASFSKFILSLATLDEIWKKVKETGISVFNTVFKSNFSFSSTDKPSASNIITPGGFGLPISTVTVEVDKVTASIPALNTLSVLGADEVNLSANALVVFHNPVNPEDPAFQIISLSKEVANFDFAQTYDLQLDFNVLQEAIAGKYGKSILYLAVATKDAAGKVVQYSSTFTKTSI